MTIQALETLYEAALHPVFHSQFHILHERDDFAHIILDGAREEFFFTLYGVDHVRLYWCNECFIFDRQRDSLVSSDTYGEIVFEGQVDAPTLPSIIIDLVLRLKDSSFVSKTERITGKTPSGYDVRKNYVVQVCTDAPQVYPYRLANILFESCCG